MVKIIKQDNIELLLEELAKMQKSLDDPEVEICIADLRSILGHVVFCLYDLIKENKELRLNILSIIKKPKKSKKIIESLYS